jgi:hypothetical protein
MRVRVPSVTLRHELGTWGALPAVNRAPWLWRFDSVLVHMNIEPPAGFGNPLGTAPGRGLGPCMAGRTLRREDLLWRSPCGSAADGVVVVRGERDTAEIPLCDCHGAIVADEAPGGP